MEAPSVELTPVVYAPDDQSRRRGLLGRISHDRMALIGSVVMLVIVAAVLAAPWLAPADPIRIDPPNRLASASVSHPLGTDMLGRDMLSRILYGGRVSLTLALAATGAVTILGTVLGAGAGLLGGATDAVIMRVVDVLQALPMLIVAMVVIGALGGGSEKLVLTVALLGWTGYARVVRAATLSIRERGFVDAARAQGATRRRILGHHIVPNLVGPLSVLSTLDLGRILLALSALSFLGFGVRPPNPEWGSMLADARNYFFLAPRLLIYPGIAISIVVLAVNLCGDGLRDAVDGRVRQL